MLNKNSSFHFLMYGIPFIFVFIFLEVFAHLTLESKMLTPVQRKELSIRYEPALFARHVIEQKEMVAQGIEGNKWFINQKGYRGHDFTTKKGKDIIRIMIYGGSQVFDVRMPLSKDWPHRIEENLKEQGLQNVEVINAGISGHASFDSFGRLFAEGHHFSPDYVILCNAWNDVKYFRKEKPLLRNFQPYVPTLDPRLYYWNGFDEFFCEHSFIYLSLRSLYIMRNIGEEGYVSDEEEHPDFGTSGPQQYDLNVKMFVELAKNIHAQPIIITQPRLFTRQTPQEDRKLIHNEYHKLTYEALNDAFEKIDQIIYKIGEDNDILVIDAAKDMSGQKEYFFDHIHFTDAGSNRIAEIVGDALMIEINKQMEQN